MQNDIKFINVGVNLLTPSSFTFDVSSPKCINIKAVAKIECMVFYILEKCTEFFRTGQSECNYKLVGFFFFFFFFKYI